MYNIGLIGNVENRILYKNAQAMYRMSNVGGQCRNDYTWPVPSIQWP